MKLDLEAADKASDAVDLEDKKPIPLELVVTIGEGDGSSDSRLLVRLSTMKTRDCTLYSLSGYDI